MAGDTFAQSHDDRLALLCLLSQIARSAFDVNKVLTGVVVTPM